MRPHEPTLSKSSFEEGGDRLPSFSGEDDPYPDEDENGDSGDNW